MRRRTLHLIGNAHLDPVWLWDWREGMNEGLTTCRTILDLMDEFDELTFVRGESAIYQHIEENDPAAFRRIVRYVEAGRWDVVGGTVVQPDTNMPSTETFARHFAHGQNYFTSRFGRPVRAAWAADSFGHAAGLPEVLAAAGITGFACSRPSPESLPTAKPAFWWEGPGGARILVYRPAVGWYGSDRDDVPKRLDAVLASAQTCDLENVAVFYGLGNHGGGPSRRQLHDIRRWAAAHPEVTVLHSGLHRLFDALRAEARRKGANALPTVRGELNFVARGCYTSVARLKHAFRRAEADLARAERTDAVIRSALRQPTADLRSAWDAVLFNSFHDILPGSSIERAYDDQVAWLGGALHQAQRVDLSALNALAMRVDTRVAKPAGDHPSAVAVLAWNPHPWPFRGHVEWETCLDYRNIVQYKGRVDEVPLRVLDSEGKPRPFQVVAEECQLGWDTPWRKRVVVPVELPPLGWRLFEFGWVEGAVAPLSPSPVSSPKPGVIDNGFYRVEARHGGRGVRVSRKGKPVLTAPGLSAVVVKDTGGSWGGPDEDMATVLERWPVTHVEVLEQGPERALLWVRLAGKRSHMDLSLHLYSGRDAVDAAVRVHWNERHALLKLAMPVAVESAEFDVPGGRVRREPCGEVPGGRWVRVFGPNAKLGFASDALYGFDCTGGQFRASVVRASAYACMTKAPVPLWRPTMDVGELKFRFLLCPGGAELPRLAQELEQPPVMLAVPAGKGALARTGSLAAVAPATLQVLALKAAQDGKGLILRVHEASGRTCAATLTWLGERLALGNVAGGTIACWRLQRIRGTWRARRTNILEG